MAQTATGNIITAIHLFSGRSTVGIILNVQEQIEDCESCPGEIRRTYDVTYRFQTDSGRLIEQSVNLGYDPLASKENSVDVIYNPKNPNESRLAHARQTTIRGAIAIGIFDFAIIALLCFLGVRSIRFGIKGTANETRQR